MILTPLDTEPFRPTEKAPGDRVILGHKAYKVLNNGAWQELDAPVLQSDPVRISPWTPLFHARFVEGLVVATLIIGVAVICLAL